MLSDIKPKHSRQREVASEPPWGTGEHWGGTAGPKFRLLETTARLGPPGAEQLLGELGGGQGTLWGCRRVLPLSNQLRPPPGSMSTVPSVLPRRPQTATPAAGTKENVSLCHRPSWLITAIKYFAVQSGSISHPNPASTSNSHSDISAGRNLPRRRGCPCKEIGFQNRKDPVSPPSVS